MLLTNPYVTSKAGRVALKHTLIDKPCDTRVCSATLPATYIARESLSITRCARFAAVVLLLELREGRGRDGSLW